MTIDPFDHLIAMLEQARYANATAFAVVTVDNETHTVVHGTGPFVEAEQALAQAGRDDRGWKEFVGDGEDPGDFSYVVVPLWAPTE